MLQFLGSKRKEQLLRSLFSDPLLEGHPGNRDSFFCLKWENLLWERFRICSGFSSGNTWVREQKSVPLVSHAFARGTPATFVIFVASRGLSSKALVLLVRTQIRHFRRFRQKTKNPLLGRTPTGACNNAPFSEGFFEGFSRLLSRRF